MLVVPFRHLARISLLSSFILLAWGDSRSTWGDDTQTPGSLAAQVGKLAKDAPAKTAAIYIAEANSTTPLVNLDGETPVKPASCNKLLTTAASFSLLGPDHIFETKIYAKGTITNGTLKGDLILQGGGDPTISGRFAKEKRDTTHNLRDWAEQLKAKGISRVTGNVIGDDSYFDENYFHSGWYGGERGEWYEAEISGLAFNDNCVDIAWSSKDLMPGDEARYVLNPKTNYATFINHVKVAAKGRPVERYYERDATSNDIVASGTLEYDFTKDDSASIHNGALYMATVFKDVLTSTGIKVDGDAKQTRGAADEKNLSLLVTHKSAPLSEVAKVINLNSQNFYAECFCKTLGKVKKNSGSFEDGASVVAQFVRDHHIFHEGYNPVDGSGLSAQNNVTARQLVETLQFMDKQPFAAKWRETIPQGQVRGSLKRRFGETSESQRLAPRIYGKTGLIGGVRSLSGWVTLPSGKEYYYSLILNGISERNGNKAVEFLDKVALAIAGVEP